MLLCVILVSYPDNKINPKTDSGDNTFWAISFGLLAPVLISLFILVSRYWTEKYGYSSKDFTIDTFMLMGLLELPFFIQVQYSLYNLILGVFASLAQIIGTFLMIYASTYGLAGPSSAMV